MGVRTPEPPGQLYAAVHTAYKSFTLFVCIGLHFWCIVSTTRGE